MGMIYLQDSGYISPTNEGTQAVSAKRVNSGTAIALKTTEFIPSLKRNISNTPNLSNNTSSEVNLGSMENMQFSLRCILNTNNSSDMDLVRHLLDAIRTNGYKFLWYDYTNATTEANNGQLIYQIARNSNYGHTFTDGEQTLFSVSGPFYHLHVHLFDAQYRHTGSKGAIMYEFKGIVLPVKTSQV